MLTSICLECNKEFQYYAAHKSGKYCCLDCQINHSLFLKIQSGNFSKNNAFTWHKRKTKYECSECKIDEWNGKKIRLQIDHIDGNNKNHNPNNLRYLCPNCHTQTETWGVKNVSEEGRKRMNDGGKKGNIKKYGLVV